MIVINGEPGAFKPMAGMRRFARKKLVGAGLLALTTILWTGFALPAPADKTILVLDASGSMWQKIPDGYKIKIAQSVVDKLLEKIPLEHELGLITYGHRRKGDCGDIELLVEPGPNNRQRISDAVNNLDPKGRTPLSASVIEAAEVLRIEENPATVILVSDGEETCDLDPCQVGTELENRGIDFTAHVIGFDVEKGEARSQLKCLAENTGGQFLAASNALELANALATVSQPLVVATPVVSVEPPDVIDRATLSAPPISEQATSLEIEWTGPDNDLDYIAVGKPGESDTINLVRTSEGSPLWLQMPPETGNYELRYVSYKDKTVLARQAISVVNADVSIDAPETAPLGERIEVSWTGPDENLDYIGIAAVGDDNVINLTRTSEGDPLQLEMPAVSGEYELRYVSYHYNHVLATQPIEVTDIEVTLDAPDQADLGQTILVEWDGPDENLDYIAVGKPGETDNANYAYTSHGNPSKLAMPSEPGDYEIRYVLYQSRTVLATRPIVVSDITVTLDAPDEADLGQTISVEWDGPDENLDYIAVGKIGDEDYVNYVYTSHGNPSKLAMPNEAGDYEIRYILHQGRKVLATKTVTVNDITVTLDAPEQADLGQTILVEWEGPDEKYDYIDVGKPGADGYVNYVYTSHGNPSKLSMPSEPGDYEIRYVLHQGRKILASKPITINDIAVTLDAPDQANLGQTIQVEWDGPNEKRDYIEVGKPGDTNFINYTYTGNGGPGKLLMPNEPGEYEIRYVLDQGRKILATLPITISDIAVTLNAPERADLGQTIEVEWDGPDEKRDYIEIGKPGESKYVNYTYTGNGNPGKLKMPSEPGDYEIRYVLDQGRKVLASRPITIEAVTVSLNAPENATIGSSIEVEWQGPDAARDYIDIANPDNGRYINYTYTKKGSPLQLKMPAEPGEYEIRYVLDQDRKILATRRIVVEAVEVTLDAAFDATIGSSIEVDWQGPDERGDYIDVVDPRKKRKLNYTRTSDGSPLQLRMPTKPGDYEIRYVMGQDKKVLATIPITVTNVEVSLDSVSEASLASIIEVSWSGPDEKGDYIDIVKSGKQRKLRFAPTRDGSPVTLQVPPVAGQYELRYVLGQGKTILATRPITITEVDVSLTVESVGPDNKTLFVSWMGPDAQNDRVEIINSKNQRSVSKTFTRTGNPLTLKLPDRPGDYELRYIVGRDNKALVSEPLDLP